MKSQEFLLCFILADFFLFRLATKKSHAMDCLYNFTSFEIPRIFHYAFRADLFLIQARHFIVIVNHVVL